MFGIPMDAIAIVPFEEVDEPQLAASANVNPDVYEVEALAKLKVPALAVAESEGIKKFTNPPLVPPEVHFNAVPPAS